MKAVSAEEAVAMIPNGASIMVGGFMGVGTPVRLLDELVRQRKSGLSIISNALPARNFNPIMAMAADTVIVTAEHIVPVGVIAPDHVVTPAPLVDYLITNG